MKRQKAKPSAEPAAAEDRLPNAQQLRQILGADRKHFEALGAAWVAVTAMPPEHVIPQVVATVLKEGGTRPVWKWETKDLEYVFLAWPEKEPLRAAVLLRGEKGKELKPVSALPLAEGLPNDLTVESLYAWEHGGGANVAVTMEAGQNPMWFYDPFYERDKADLTAGVTHTFLLSALAFGVRRALLDEVTITQGPVYEAYATKWLAENSGKTRVDVPPLKLDVHGKHIIYPGANFGEYQIRAVIDDVESCTLDKMPITILYTTFPFAERAPMRLPIYVSKAGLHDFTPQKGQEIDAYVWFQGRVIDYSANE
ncbi:MAG: hypothetical protein IK079_01335 [Desulfovibrio sp.]|nr:hypothetical protein [Desulfovibrio sp.]